MHASHDHAHRHVRTPPVQAGVSLLRLSALIWLVVYLVVR
jgi:hypothetical protein